jgi:peptidyl-prolyl cis-trans isomerase C
MTVNQNKTIISIAVAVLAILLIVPAVCSSADPPAGQIAVVNDATVLRQDLDREMKLVALKLSRQGRSISDEQLKRYEGNIRETLINRTLLLQQSQTKGITVKDNQVTKALDEFKAGFQDDKEYQRAMIQMGYTEAILKDQIKNGLTIKALIDKEVGQHVSVSDNQVRTFYDEHPDLFRQPEQVKASHILIQVPADADEAKKAAALASIQSLKQRIDKGENFANLAMENSDCPSKAKGGDLGFFSREQMVQPFSEAAFALQPGQVSDVVTTRFGYHLIRVTERKDAQAMAFNDVKEEISNRLRQEQEEKKIGDYLERIKKNADIQRFPL